ncbi:MAG: hypothetical protein KGI35_04295 [Burkholderiales bacterium]|nr:hypothetical protein [Burkholderiales bacterium]MDE2397083.1 hypothetical protein [Burkholderiales bacterium]
MTPYRHHVLGFFALRDDATSALGQLADRGIANECLHIVPSESSSLARFGKDGSDAALKDILVDGAIGTAVGAGVGVAAEVALVAANASLFIASPLLAPLVMLGWGAGIGATLGAIVGAEKKSGSLKALVQDAVSTGQFVLVAQTRSKAATAIAQEVIQAAVGVVKEASTV